MATSPTPHLVLARKWRPERFNELVGQEHVTRTLVQALKSGRIAHAFLFTGIRGVGKTTAARILARCLDCEQGPTDEPCGQCPACIEIRAGRSLDVVEIDGATYRKIDDARAIIENLSYRPARDRFKVYIIDEAHQLTDQAFNALLKTLEEPPAHVKFILATTEPQKMPETILSRLQRYDFRRIPFAIILDRLKELAEREGFDVEEAALRLIAREAGGSMRDAERMLETAIAQQAAKVTESEVASTLGIASRLAVFKLTEAILKKDASGALAAVRELHRRGANLESLGRDLLEVLRNLAVAKLPRTDVLDPLGELPDHESADLRRLAEPASNRDLMRLFRLMANAQEQILRSPYPDLLLEMAVVRMATIAPVIDAEQLLRAIDAAGAGPAAGSSQAPPNSPGSPGPAASTWPSASVAGQERSGARRVKVEGEVKADAPRRFSAPAGVGTAKSAAAGAPGDLPELRAHIRSRRPALAGFMEQGADLVLNDELITVVPRNDIYVRYLNDNRNAIAELASELYRRKLRVQLSVQGTPASTENAQASDNGLMAGQNPSVESEADANSATTPLAGAPTSSLSGLAAEPLPSAGTGESTAGENGGPSGRANQAELRQAVYADPIVQQIFAEFEARLVDVRERKHGKSADTSRQR
jgi:DNA polymerase III subunit gamma/tau